ncbi:hypothetical protein G3I60_41730, partial [Streptomyces sp. SID13666]|nr:hypothetical protein [Streptomyces sp. SID13666]
PVRVAGGALRTPAARPRLPRARSGQAGPSRFRPLLHSLVRRGPPSLVAL